MAESFSVALVGRNAIIREGLSRILADYQFDVVHSVSGVEELSLAFEAAERSVDIVLIDSGAWDVNSEELSNLQLNLPAARIVVLMETFDFNTMLASLRAGAHGLVVTKSSCESLIESLKLVALGERVLPSQVADHLPSYMTDVVHWRPETRLRGTNLSSREIEILRCLMMGCPNKVISLRLSITEVAVKVHVKAVLRKIPVKNRTQAAIWAVNRGITAFDTGDRMVESARLDVIPTMPIPAARPELNIQPA